MNNRKRISTYPNPDLIVTHNNRPRWNQQETRRHGFHNFYRLPRYTLSFRAAQILQLETNIDASIGARTSVQKMINNEFFSGMAVIRGQELIFETYAKDFHYRHPHLAMSVTKLTMNLICGELISNNQLNPNKRVKDYIPEMGSGYADATIQ